MKEYIVGIDFGNAETSAWFIRINRGMPNAQSSGSVNLINATNQAGLKIRTAINLTKDGHFSTTEPGTIIIDFKARISTLDDQKRPAYEAFIKDIYKRIITNNDYLTGNGIGDSNFYICIACPTKWNEEDRQEYINFFNNALSEFHQEILFLISESDAAYFPHRDNDNDVLVIDFGSSTIDYTLICKGLKVSDDDWSNDYLGARAVERAMLESYRRCLNSNFQQTKLATEQLLQQNGYAFYDVRTTLEYNLRIEKERAYTNYNPDNLKRPFDYKFSYTFYTETGENILNDDQYKFSTQGFFRGTSGVCESYINAVRNDFVNLKSRVDELNVSINKIILSGGACNMGWIKEKIIEIFGGNVDIDIDDSNPEYVVAKGIALYAENLLKNLGRLRRELNNISYINIYKDGLRTILQEKTLECINNCCTQIRQESSLNGSDILNHYMSYIKSINDESKEICIQVKEVINASIKEEVRIIKERICPNDISDLSFEIEPCIESLYPNFYFEEGGFFYKIVKSGIESTRFNFTWDQFRNSDEVETIIRVVNKSLTGNIGCDDFINKVPNIDQWADNIRTDILLCIDRLFFNNMLFKPTFKVEDNYINPLTLSNNFNFLREEIERISYRNIYEDVLRTILQEKTLECINNCCTQIRQYSILNGLDILNYYMRYIKSINNSEKIYTQVKEVINARIKEEVRRIKERICPNDILDLSFEIEPRIGFLYPNFYFEEGGFFYEIVKSGIESTRIGFTWDQHRNGDELETIIRAVNRSLEKNIGRDDFINRVPNRNERISIIKKDVLLKIDEILSNRNNYFTNLGISQHNSENYLTENISYSQDKNNEYDINLKVLKSNSNNETLLFDIIFYDYTGQKNLELKFERIISSVEESIIKVPFTIPTGSLHGYNKAVFKCNNIEFLNINFLPRVISVRFDNCWFNMFLGLGDYYKACITFLPWWMLMPNTTRRDIRYICYNIELDEINGRCLGEKILKVKDFISVLKQKTQLNISLAELDRTPIDRRVFDSDFCFKYDDEHSNIYLELSINDYKEALILNNLSLQKTYIKECGILDNNGDPMAFEDMKKYVKDMLQNRYNGVCF
ncbi:MAG: hypothetical protein IKV26_03165 [Paludibacteraceae bacterium]|nr:hypothetical protein [Paludibacteraceae bacterium]